MTTQRKDVHPVAENLINQDFNPEQSNQVRTDDVTYLRTHESWMYLAIVMDLYSRRIIGWAIHKRMTDDLVNRGIQMAINLRNPDKGLIFHSDQGSQFTSKVFGQSLKSRTIRASKCGVGACWDNAVVERVFRSLKSEWLLKVYHLTRQGMKQDVDTYIRYYNQDRLHTASGDLSTVEDELSQIKVSGWA